MSGKAVTPDPKWEKRNPFTDILPHWKATEVNKHETHLEHQKEDTREAEERQEEATIKSNELRQKVEGQNIKTELKESVTIVTVKEEAPAASVKVVNGDLSEKSTTKSNKLIFGKTLRNIEYPHHPSSLLRLNNGAFGSCPKSVLNFQSGIKNQFLANPDEFWSEFGDLMFQSRLSIAEMISSNYEDVAIVQNAQVANTVVAEEALRLCQDQNSEGVILLSVFTHPSIIKAMVYARSRSKGKLRIEFVELPFPVHDSWDLVQAYSEQVAQLKGTLLLAVLDHVSDSTSILFPIHEIAELCRDAGFRRIFVDGSQAFGTVADLDVPSMGVDYYVGNIHVWMFAPVSTAFFWAKGGGGVRDELHNPIVSSGFGSGFAKEFSWSDSGDYSAMLSVPAATEFFKSFGKGGEDSMEIICRRNHDLAVIAGMGLAELWGTEVGTSPDLCTSMIMVGLPTCLGSTLEDAKAVHKILQSEWHIITQRGLATGGRLWLRLSVAVYNYREEFDVLGEAILSMAKSHTKEAPPESGRRKSPRFFGWNNNS